MTVCPAPSPPWIIVFFVNLSLLHLNHPGFSSYCLRCPAKVKQLYPAHNVTPLLLIHVHTSAAEDEGQGQVGTSERHCPKPTASQSKQRLGCREWGGAVNERKLSEEAAGLVVTRHWWDGEALTINQKKKKAQPSAVRWVQVMGR